MKAKKIEIFRRIITDELLDDEIELLFRMFKNKEAMGEHPAYWRERREDIYEILYDLNKNKFKKEEINEFLNFLEEIRKQINNTTFPKQKTKEIIAIKNNFLKSLRKYKKEMRDVDIYFATWLAKKEVSYEYLKSRNSWQKKKEFIIFNLAAKMKEYLAEGNIFEIDKTVDEFKKESIQLEDLELNINCQSEINNFLASEDVGFMYFYKESDGLHYFPKPYKISREILNKNEHEKKNYLLEILKEILKKEKDMSDVSIYFEEGENNDDYYEDIDLDFDI